MAWLACDRSNHSSSTTVTRSLFETSSTTVVRMQPLIVVRDQRTAGKRDGFERVRASRHGDDHVLELQAIGSVHLISPINSTYLIVIWPTRLGDVLLVLKEELAG